MATQKKIIMVTGASSGIGRATLRELVREGHVVYGSYRSREDAQSITESGGIPLMIEMADHATLRAAVAYVIHEHGRLDVLCNNAGYGLYGAVEDVTINEARQQFEVNLFGLARLTQLVLPQMRTQGSGTIINMSSMGGKMYTPLGAWYHASKHALEGWSDCLRFELRQFNINVVIIEPGEIATNFADTLAGPLLMRSSGGPYVAMTQALLRALTSPAHAGSPPEVVGRAVADAVRAARPKTRYIAGQRARLMITARRLLGDRLFDRILLQSIS